MDISLPPDAYKILVQGLSHKLAIQKFPEEEDWFKRFFDYVVNSLDEEKFNQFGSVKDSDVPGQIKIPKNLSDDPTFRLIRDFFIRPQTGKKNDYFGLSYNPEKSVYFLDFYVFIGLLDHFEGEPFAEKIRKASVDFLTNIIIKKDNHFFEFDEKSQDIVVRTSHIKTFFEHQLNYLEQFIMSGFLTFLNCLRGGSYGYFFFPNSLITIHDLWDTDDNSSLGTITRDAYTYLTLQLKRESEMQKNLNQIFIVHGHDEEMKQHVARVLEQLKLRPIILHEQPNMGRTIIEKFENYSHVQFAVVILSPDDKGYSKDSSPKLAKYRARQNVIFELGFFIGKLGRDRVVGLYRKNDDFELPSDFSGVLYIEYDDKGAWRYRLIDELKTAQFKVSKDDLVS